LGLYAKYDESAFMVSLNVTWEFLLEVLISDDPIEGGGDGCDVMRHEVHRQFFELSHGGWW